MSWEQLHAIYAEAAQLAADERDRPPVACPIDGEPLQLDADGNLRCGWDGWVWRGVPLS